MKYEEEKWGQICLVEGFTELFTYFVRKINM